VIPDSLLSGDNAAFLDDQYEQWLREPASVHPTLQALFASLEKPGNGNGHIGPRVRPRSIFAGGVGVAAGAAPSADPWLQARAVQLINAYRVRGHLDAAVDPLDRRERVAHPELTLEWWGLS
jgi:2-oxoglutarate dehydrogenase E1 component